MSTRTLGCTILAFAAMPVFAQTPQLAGPHVGMLMDGNQVRVVTGVPGAALAGNPISLPGEIADAVISPNQDYVVGASADGRVTLLDSPFNGIPRTMDAFGKIFLSRTGSTMAVWSQPSDQITVWSGIPGAPALAWKAGLPAGSEVSMLAVSDDASAVAAVLRGGGVDSIWRITPQEQGVLSTSDRIAGVAFLGHRTDLVVVESATRRAVLFRDISGAAAASALGDIPADAGTPVGVATSSDGDSVYIATADPGGVVLINSTSHGSRFLPCACSPSGISGIGASAFQLTAASDPVIWLFQASRAEAKVYFLPGTARPHPSNIVRRSNQ